MRRGREQVDGERVERVLPDGAVQVLFELGAAPRAIVVGASATASTIRLVATVEHVGAQ